MISSCHLPDWQGQALCKECFYNVFEEEVHRTVTDGRIFKRGETVAVAASGGKGPKQLPLHS